jgi:hypothetical protein
MNRVTTSSSAKQLSGIWRSDYIYRSSDRNEDRKSVEYVRFYPNKYGFVVETVPKANESYELARFSVEGDVVTGTWQSNTSPKGDYKGAVYHGAAQLIISDDGKRLAGKWVGFGKNMVVKTGPWEFTYLGDDASVLDNMEAAHGQ